MADTPAPDSGTATATAEAAAPSPGVRDSSAHASSHLARQLSQALQPVARC
jgi:hypothetical protein